MWEEAVFVVQSMSGGKWTCLTLESEELHSVKTRWSGRFGSLSPIVPDRKSHSSDEFKLDTCCHRTLKLPLFVQTAGCPSVKMPPARYVPMKHGHFGFCRLWLWRSSSGASRQQCPVVTSGLYPMASLTLSPTHSLYLSLSLHTSSTYLPCAWC